MSISMRFITIEDEQCIIHLPEKPNGFAILILGDRNHFVNKTSSLWMESYPRKKFLQDLLQDGYTVFYGNLGGAHWGNDQAFQLMERLVNYVLRTEIINEKIHLYAEGMGALLAFRFLQHPFIQVRSLVLYNPCIDVKGQMEEEKTNKFFFKRMIHELEEAYGVRDEEINKVCIRHEKDRQYNKPTPIRIFQVIYQAPYSPDIHVRPFLMERQELKEIIATTYFMPGKTMDQFREAIVSFYRKHE